MKKMMDELAEEIVTVPAGKVRLEGNLVIPPQAKAIVLFAHGSGSSRHSIRNRFVAGALQEGDLATLLFDLLSAEEETIDIQTTHLRFDIALLAERLIHAIDWIARSERTRSLKIGLFGSSTGAGAALVAAAQRPEVVGAVVSRGGRPDLAGSAISQVKAPTLLIVGGRDISVISLNRQAIEQLRCENQLEIIDRATHLFEEPGALEDVARLAREWFVKKLV
jgi:dienelactone hydrolase